MAQVIANHIMPCISFATGGDPVDYDIIGYVSLGRIAPVLTAESDLFTIALHSVS